MTGFRGGNDCDAERDSRERRDSGFTGEKPRFLVNVEVNRLSDNLEDLELEVNEDDIEELIIRHEDELTIEELQEILNEEHQETQRNVSPSE
ncbi:hypothetical protein TNCV_1948571 [Trichonephila clavipes]|nr:hypothetical protein TNCV_1948571 [Trichonephila clavipes]